MTSKAQCAWRLIKTAPRDSTHVLLYCPRSEPDRQTVMEGWWAIPWEGAPPEKGWWQTMGGTMLSADVHDGLGATHWMPLPSASHVSGGVADEVLRLRQQVATLRRAIIRLDEGLSGAPGRRMSLEAVAKRLEQLAEGVR